MEGEGTGVFLYNDPILRRRSNSATENYRRHSMTSARENYCRRPEAAASCWSNEKSKRMFGSRGPRMHTMFINARYQQQTTPSCGTGFFLPRSGYYHMQQPTGKTPSAPVVLLPSHVVHALNLNDHVHPPLLVGQPMDQDLPASTPDSALPPPVSPTIVDASGEDSTTPIEVLLPDEWIY